MSATLTPVDYRGVVEVTRAAGGMTFDRGGQPITGDEVSRLHVRYVVGGVPNAFRLGVPGSTFRAADVGLVVGKNPRADWFGTWEDDKGTVWVEPVDMVATESVALDLARERREVAIFDLATGTEIRTGE